MSENSTPEERIELDTKARLEALREGRAIEADNSKVANSSLSSLGWLSAGGFILTIIAMFVIGASTSPGPVTMLFWPAMLTVGPTVGFLSLVAYLATKAIITSRK